MHLLKDAFGSDCGRWICPIDIWTDRYEHLCLSFYDIGYDREYVDAIIMDPKGVLGILDANS
jgi:hypothetical protein